MNSTTLNTIGLALGIVGVILLFFFGFPQPSFEHGVSIDVEDGTVIDEKGTTAHQYAKQALAAKRDHESISSSGLALVGLGFVFQLWALYSDDKKKTDKAPD